MSTTNNSTQTLEYSRGQDEAEAPTSDCSTSIMDKITALGESLERKQNRIARDRRLYASPEGEHRDPDTATRRRATKCLIGFHASHEYAGLIVTKDDLTTLREARKLRNELPVTVPPSSEELAEEVNEKLEKLRELDDLLFVADWWSKNAYSMDKPGRSDPGSDFFATLKETTKALEEGLSRQHLSDRASQENDDASTQTN